MHLDLIQQHQVIFDFYGSYFLKSEDFLYDSLTLHKLQKHRYQGRYRLPYMTILTGQFLIHHYEQGNPHHPRWYICTNVVEWIITWFRCVYQLYPDGCLPESKGFLTHWKVQFHL